VKGQFGRRLFEAPLLRGGGAGRGGLGPSRVVYSRRRRPRWRYASKRTTARIATTMATTATVEAARITSVFYPVSGSWKRRRRVAVGSTPGTGWLVVHGGNGRFLERNLRVRPGPSGAKVPADASRRCLYIRHAFRSTSSASRRRKPRRRHSTNIVSCSTRRRPSGFRSPVDRGRGPRWTKSSLDL
jgi:hypothetical protein